MGVPIGLVGDTTFTLRAPISLRRPRRSWRASIASCTAAISTLEVVERLDKIVPTLASRGKGDDPVR